MHFNYTKSLVLSGICVLGLGGLLWGYTHSHTALLSAGGGLLSHPSVPSQAAGSLLTTGVSERQALLDRDHRHGRSPAFVAGTTQDKALKAFVEHAISDPKVASTQAKLKSYFPDETPINLWIRAAMTLGTSYSDGELSPEHFEAIGKVYAQVLDGEESAVTSLGSALATIPLGDSAIRVQAFHMLSDIALKDKSLRGAVKEVLLTEAARAGSQADGALAFTMLLRINPTKAWYQEVAQTYSKMHPGSELSDFVSLNVANL
jgi:hypothetical protein